MLTSECFIFCFTDNSYTSNSERGKWCSSLFALMIKLSDNLCGNNFTFWQTLLANWVNNLKHKILTVNKNLHNHLEIQHRKQSLCAKTASCFKPLCRLLQPLLCFPHPAGAPQGAVSLWQQDRPAAQWDWIAGEPGDVCTERELAHLAAGVDGRAGETPPSRPPTQPPHWGNKGNMPLAFV